MLQGCMATDKAAGACLVYHLAFITALCDAEIQTQPTTHVTNCDIEVLFFRSPHVW